jgi:thiamine kinase-like enzyme
MGYDPVEREARALLMATAAHPAIASTVEDVIRRIEAWRGQAVSVRALANGLTNLNYRVDVGGRAFVVRIPGASTELLLVDRDQEHESARIAAELGIAPRVVHHLPDLQAMIVDFVDGRSMTNAAFQAPEMPARIAATLRVLHAGPRFRRDVDMLGLARAYQTLAARRGFAVPASWPRRLPTIRRIGAALAARPLPTVPCHNDLLADNYIDDGTRLWIVDWEYSGNNDPAFELGNTCRELDYDDARIAAVCEAYFGVARAPLVARVKLQMVVSDVGWALWAAVQAAISRLDFDFRAYGQARWERAEAAMDAPDFPRWLEAVRRPTRSR